MVQSDRVWYVAYGSNLEAAGINHYLGAAGRNRVDAHRHSQLEQNTTESRWVNIPHSLYFAGRSRTWGGPVAFVSLTPARGNNQARGRAFLLTLSELQEIVRRENGYESLPDISFALRVPVAGWAPIPVSLDDEGFTGKYNALLRLPDAPDGRQVMTLTTSRVLAIAPPSEPYLARVRAGLTLDPDPTDVRERLAPALEKDRLNAEFVNLKPAIPMQWRGELSSAGQSRGFPSVTLPRRFNGTSPELTMAQGTVVFPHRRVGIWILFERGEQATYSPEVERLLGSELIEARSSHSAIVIEVEEVHSLRQLPGLSQDLPDSDVVHVSSAEALRLGRWALVVNGGVAGPVRVLARPRILEHEIRMAYAGRTLLSQERGGPVHLQPIRPDPGLWANFIVRPFRALGELVFGAPATALRATEGLVGDEGRPIVRVDSGALDFIGVEAGDTVLVTWAHRKVQARVLLQSDLTRPRMESQLSEATGQQFRAGAEAAVASRLAVPPHLRVWVSPALRAALGVPTDTVVRVRRSIGHLLMKNSARFALSIAAIIVGGLAIRTVNLAVWLVVSVLLFLLSLAPLRLRQMSGREPRPPRGRR